MANEGNKAQILKRRITKMSNQKNGLVKQTDM